MDSGEPSRCEGSLGNLAGGSGVVMGVLSRALDSHANGCGELWKMVKSRFCWVGCWVPQAMVEVAEVVAGFGKGRGEWGGHVGCQASKWDASGGGQSRDGRQRWQ